MTGIDLFTGYVLLMGITAGVGLLYLLYIERYLIEYDPFFVITVSGLFLFIIGGPVLELVYPTLVHWVHGLAACLVLFGLYSPVQNDLRKDQWAELLLAEPAQIRAPSQWMVPMDDAILSLFHSADLVLTPAIIAYNIDHSREEVNRRLRKLEAATLVEKVERGKYRITPDGEAYLAGELIQHCRRVESSAAGEWPVGLPSLPAGIGRIEFQSSSSTDLASTPSSRSPLAEPR